MKNKIANQQELVNVITEAVYVGNGKSINSAVQKINEEFILIKKSDLPVVEPKAHVWKDQSVPTARTAGYRLGRNPEVYWDRALDFIAVALYAEQEEGKQAERELAGKREEAYRMLFPEHPPLWTYANRGDTTKKQIDVVVNLMNQVDELKESK